MKKNYLIYRVRQKSNNLPSYFSKISSSQFKMEFCNFSLCSLNVYERARKVGESLKGLCMHMYDLLQNS